jgi:hypothetical protein
VRRAALVAAVLLVAGCGVRPSGVILGGPAPTVASAAQLYLVFGGRITPVLRPNPPSADALTLLAAGPTTAERNQGYTTEVPVGIALDATGSTVAVSVDVTTLSPNAFDQIVCTASPGSTPVVVTGGGQSRGPRSCPAA